jgi:hypothetical protein
MVEAEGRDECFTWRAGNLKLNQNSGGDAFEWHVPAVLPVSDNYKQHTYTAGPSVERCLSSENSSVVEFEF